MEQALTVHRLHFAFTITFHYIFPQLTMGLALLLVYLKTKFLRTGDEHYNRSARFWAASSQLILPSVSSLESRWNFSLAPTGRRFRELPAASLGKYAVLLCTSCSMASILAPAPSICLSRKPMNRGARCSPASARFGMATKFG